MLVTEGLAMKFEALSKQLYGFAEFAFLSEDLCQIVQALPDSG
jgi:hypothetical protein